MKTTRPLDHAEHRARQIHACRALSREGLIAGAAGNVSMRISRDQVLATPSGGAKGELEADELVLIGLEGQTLDGSRRAASSEIQVHLHIYHAEPRVHAVVHAHPITATALAGLERLDLCVTAEGAASLGPVAQIAYVRPGTRELAALCARAVAEGATTLLLAHHGAVTVGRTLDEALHRMSSLEHVARVWLAMKQAGSFGVLDEAEVRVLRGALGLSTTWPARARRYSLDS